jgi:hypothetical protein
LRYGDSSVWDLLRSLAERAQPVALVVNRVPQGAWEAIANDIGKRLGAAGLDRVALFQIPELDNTPAVLPASLVEPLRQWLTDHFPIPERQADSPDLRVVLGQLAADAAGLVTAQAVHQASVDLLKTATETQSASAAETAAGAADETPAGAATETQPPAAGAHGAGAPVLIAPSTNSPPEAGQDQINPRLTEAWLDQIGPDGPLANISLTQEITLDRRRQLDSGLAALGRAVSDAVAPGFRDVMTNARAAMVAVWQGEDVPEGTRALLQRRGLDQAELAGDLTGSAGYGLWVEGLATRLRKRSDMATKATQSILTIAGLVSLIQAAVLGAEGPRGLAAGLLGDQAESVIEDGREALREARAGSARLALAVFSDTVRELDRTASETLSWAADRLAYAAKKVDE